MRESTVLVTAPAADAFAITLAEAKAHLRLEHDEEDSTIEAAIAAATELFEGETSRQFRTATYELRLRKFEKRMRLYPLPVQSIESILYRDPSGAEQELDAEVYEFENYVDSATIVAAPSRRFPMTDGTEGAVRIRFLSGWEDPIPPLAKAGLKLLVGHFYENREATGDRVVREVPYGIRRILDAFDPIEDFSG